MGSRRASGGAGEQDTGLVVGWVSISPPSAFDVLDAGVRCLCASVGYPAGDQHLDGGPPSLHGRPEPPGLLHVGSQYVAAQDHLLVAGLWDRAGVEEPPELFFDTPGGGELIGGVVAGEHGVETGSSAGRQGVVAAEQQSSVCPGQVDFAASALFRRCHVVCVNTSM